MTIKKPFVLVDGSKGPIRVTFFGPKRGSPAAQPARCAAIGPKAPVRAQPRPAVGVDRLVQAGGRSGPLEPRHRNRLGPANQSPRPPPRYGADQRPNAREFGWSPPAPLGCKYRWREMDTWPRLGQRTYRDR